MDACYFSDESPYPIERQDGRKRVWRRKGERFAPGCITTVRDKRSVMIWGAMSLHGKSQLVVVNANMNAERYINDILTPHVLPFFNAVPAEGRMFQQDNAPPHAARVTRAFLEANNVGVMLSWPANSQDLNPIKPWHLGRAVRGQANPPRNPAEMTRALTDAWNAVDKQTLRRLVFSMRRRCRAVIAANGGYTSYYFSMMNKVSFQQSLYFICLFPFHI